MVSVVAHHPYEATQDDEISFKKDDHINVTDNSDPDWWVGTLETTGATGLFPSNFVTVVTEEAQDKPAEKAPEQQEAVEEQQEEKKEEEQEKEEEEVPEKKDSIIGMARVMEDYASQESGELSLHKGGIINVYQVIDDEWARGEINGKVGKYPTKYTEDIDMPGRPDFGMQANDAVKKEQEGGFKLAAFGVKQGGIGSLFGGGFPGLKKTNPKQSEPTESKPAAASVPSVPASAPSVPKPANEPSPVEETKPAAVEETKPEQPEPESAKKSLGKAIVLHPYDADNADELSLLRGEYVDILDREADEGWWEGKNERGETGIFPSNFVKELQEDVTTVPPPTRARTSINTPTSPTGQLPPVPSNTRPPANRPVTVQPSSNTPPIPSSAPRPSSVNSPAPARPTPPPFDKKNILPVANVDQDVKEEPAQPEEIKPAAIEEEEEEKKIEPVVEEKEEEEAFVDSQPEPKKEQDVIKEDAPQEVSPEPITEEPVVEQAPVEEETKVEETEKEQEIPSVEPAEKEEGEKKVETPIEEKEEEQVKEEENKVEEPSAEDEPSADDKAEEPSAQEEPKEEEPSGLNTIPTSGPKLTTPSRARIGGNRARRNITPTSEPSQTEVLQKDLEQMPEPEKKAAPPKPVKPIFAKFPTPFASGEDITKHQLKPVTRRPWEVKQQEQQEAAAAAATTETKEEEPVRPTGVKNLASRFNFAGNSGGGGNEVLETKLKNHTKNEVEKVRKEFEHLLQEEREKRNQLEDKVAVLMERLEALENK